MKILLTMVGGLSGVIMLAGSASASVTRFAPLDVKAIHLAEVEAERKGEAPRYAIPREVSVAPATTADFAAVGDTYVWRHRVTAPNVVSLNFGFTEFRLPEGAALRIASADGSQLVRDFTSADNNDQNQLWTPVIMTDDATIELVVPSVRLADLRFRLGHVGLGFRTFSQPTQKSGSCNIDVACDDSKGWEKEVNSVAVISTGGSTFCTGFMVNNTKNDRQPLFMTANHCGISASNSASLVVYWNYQKSACGGSRDGKLSQFQTGSTFLAAHPRSDFTLVRLNSAPQEEWHVNFAGWNRADENAKTSVAIHHPATHEKSISFDNDSSQLTSYLGQSEGGDRTHVRVVDWDRGTTEPGSSGSPLFDQNHRVIGQLHGGWAACGNEDSDYYGRLAVSWEGGGTSSTRLKDHLDPAGTGAQAADTL